MDAVTTVESSKLAIDWQPVGNAGSVRLSVKLNGDTIDCDKIDVSRASAREKYAKRLASKFPGIDRDGLESELLSIADKVSTPKVPEANTDAPELDVSAITRPELFHAEAVSGILIPTASIFGGEPVGRWRLYLRWHGDDKRECRDLSESIDLPDCGRLWFHPIPTNPRPTVPPGWTKTTRQAWLDGADAPNAAELFQRTCERFAHYLDFTGDAARGDVVTLALWTMFTYCYPCWTAVPYLNIGGPKESGKTRTFELLSRLAFRPVQSSNMTAACLFRTLHECGGVLLLDEAETLRDKSENAGAIRSILLSGYKAGSPARRLESAADGKFLTLSFDVFGPKGDCWNCTTAGRARQPVRPARHVPSGSKLTETQAAD